MKEYLFMGQDKRSFTSFFVCFFPHGNHYLSPNIVTTPPLKCMQSFQNQSFCDFIYIRMNLSTEHKHVVTMGFW